MKKYFFRRLFFSAIIFFICASSTFSQNSGIEFSGNVKSSFGTFLPYSKNVGNFSCVKENLFGQLDAYAQNSKLFVSGNLELDVLKLSNDFNEQKVQDKFSLTSITGTLQEAYVQWHSTAFGPDLEFCVTAGRQLCAWGKADGICVTDILCPKNYKSLNFANYSESRLGIDAINLGLNGSFFGINFYFVPISKKSQLPLEKNNLLRNCLIPETVSTAMGNLSVNLKNIEQEKASFENSTYATKISFWLTSFDFSLYYYHGFDDMPVLNYQVELEGAAPKQINITGSYNKFTMLGFDIAIPISQFMVRGETAFFIDKSFSQENNDFLSPLNLTCTKKKNQLVALLGFDWMLNSWTITCQYFEDFVFDASKLFNRKQRENGATLSISKSLFSESLKLSLSSAVKFNEFDNYWSFEAEYSATDALIFGFNVNAYLEGKSKGEYGKYKDLSDATVFAKYSF